MNQLALRGEERGTIPLSACVQPMTLVCRLNAFRNEPSRVVSGLKL